MYMKFFRRPVVSKMIITFFIVNLLNSVFLPTYSYALTGGPNQIEYTSYEEPGATDMVNMLTGDFSYSLPVLDVPGPEGSFSLPLSYHAGIGLEQEASWVGLGWSMNAGAIVRSINEFPDDASGESHSVNVKNMNVIRGWDSNLGIVRLGWNNQDGHYGTVSLFNLVSYSWNESGPNSVGIVGINMSSQGVTFDALTFMSAVITVATWGAAGAIEGGKFVASEIVKSAAMDAATQFVMGAALGGATPNTPTGGYWKQTKKEKRKVFHREYKIWLNHTRTEDMYGALYLGSVTNYVASETSDFGISLSLNNNGTNETLYRFGNGSNNLNKGSASDMNFNIDEGIDFEDAYNPAVLAYDNYQVYGHGVSGAISPYRLDVGSVSMPRKMTPDHARLAPVKYQNYKVPFLYEGVPANSYFHHVGASSSVTTPTFYHGISHTLGNSNTENNTSLKYNLTDVVLKNERVRADVNATKRIANGNHIEWLSNNDIKNTVTYPSKFMDFLPGGNPSLRYDFRSNFTLGSATPTSIYLFTSSFSNEFEISLSTYDALNDGDPVGLYLSFFQSELDKESGNVYEDIDVSLTVAEKYISNNKYYITLSNDLFFTTYAGWIADVTLTVYQTPQIQNAIGGYVITAQDGTNYHYALPIYDYELKTEIVDANDDDKSSRIERKQAFANTWLLTAITYPDFIDRNNNGLVDDSDWGGWIKLNYGKQSDQYKWRAPYYDNSYKMDPEGKMKSYSQGTRQLYYLNSIETRSHVALFLKSNRADAIGKTGTVQLKLDEISLLTKEHYQKLKSQYNIPEYANQIATTCLSSAFAPTAIRNFVNKNAQKRIVFEYTYNLCQGTPNSTDSTQGKLTLTKVSIRGKDDLKTVPDFKFEYGNNPLYSEHKWDAWGLYTRNGASSGTAHKTSPYTEDAAAWSLKKIITPLGSEIEVNYEHDEFASVSGYGVPPLVVSSNDTNLSDGIVNDFTSGTSLLQGDRVTALVTESYSCQPDPAYVCDDPYTGQQIPCPDEIFTEVIASQQGTVVGNQVILDEPVTYSQGNPPCNYGSSFDYSVSVSIQKNYVQGGDLRVGSIVMTDEFGINNKIRYIYRDQSGNCSGVIGKSNPYAMSTNYAFEKWPEVPGTPVMYSHVSVLNGNLSNDTDYHTKTSYEFETPHHSMVIKNTYPEVLTTTIRKKYIYAPAKVLVGEEKLTIKRHTIENHTAKIGNLKSIKVYDNLGALKSTTNMDYTNEIVNDDGTPNQGIYSQGTLMFDRVKEGNTYYHKVNKTTILRYAYVLKDVITTKDGNTTKSENSKWDFITGNVLEKIETSALGVKVKSVSVPAYKVSNYSEFKSKAFDSNNKNMLSQNAAQYSYLLDAAGNEVGLLGASAQTWKKDWATYRVFNSGTGTFSDGTESDQIWRKGPSYVWKGDYGRLRTDGTQTFAVGDKYNFTSGAPNTGWQYVGEVLRYDHYNMPLEARDLNNIRSISKMGYDNKIKILSASNAEFGEVAFSSAEDLNTTTGFFASEVALKNTGGNAAVVKKSTGGEAHTGDCAISLSSGYGFVYKPFNLKPNKLYRASVWTNSINGRIYYKFEGSSEQLSAQPTVLTKAGNWYLIELLIPVGAIFSPLEVGIKTTSGTVLFDDFRFQPVDASMTCFVYNPLDFENTTDLKYSEYVLDNDNLFTRYQYNEKGMLYRTYRESIKFGGEKLVSETASDYRRFHVNQ